MDVVSDDEGQEPVEQHFTIDDLDDRAAGRTEIIDGSLHVSPPPFCRHTIIENNLPALLRALLPDDLRAFTGAGVHRVSGTTRWLVPDTVVVRADAVARRPDYLAPEDVVVVVEVVSPSSVTHDRVTKRALYAEMGIEHYWIVEQLTEVRLTALRLEGPEYEEAAVFGPEDTVELAEPFPVRFRLAELVAQATRPGVPASVTIGRPAASQAYMPPSRLTTSRPWAASQAVTCADRPPTRQTTTMGSVPGMSAARPGSSLSGTWVAPAMCPAAHSSSSRTSSTVASAATSPACTVGI
jgi:Uma2 family endonuclease